MKRTLSGLLTLAVFVALAGGFLYVANDGRWPWQPEADHGEDWCAAHQEPLSTCEQCNVELRRGGTFTVSDREPAEGECPNTCVRIMLAPGAAEQVDLQFHTLKDQEISERIRANAETRYPPAKYARVAPRISGIIREVKAIFGQEVEQGDVLAVVESADFAKAKASYLGALAVLELREKTYEQEKALFDKKISAGRDLLAAKAALAEARLGVRRASQWLSTLGLSQEAIDAIPGERNTSPLLDVVAPFDGAVVEASAVIGERATPDRPIFAVANMKRLWVTIDVYEADLPKIEEGQRVSFRVEGLPGTRFRGKVIAIGGEVDDRARTVPVYADVKNLRGLLRAQMFGTAEIVVSPAEAKLLVPKEAIQNDGDCDLVFVSPKKDVFQARAVELGTAYRNGYEVRGGVAKGERVVTRGSFLLKTEVLREQIGAG
ncbi:MAG: efflux RND transporter periplasmic adaptor subunit [Planctomycetota bacterium]|jgi:cobalt-zinc-cadmium efflux system membrane fusion protein